MSRYIKRLRQEEKTIREKWEQISRNSYEKSRNNTKHEHLS